MTPALWITVVTAWLFEISSAARRVASASVRSTVLKWSFGFLSGLGWMSSEITS